MLGATFGHYRIVGQIGAGGMGEVYRAHDESLDRDVALKILPGASFGDPAARARLLREARSAAALNHPHICTVYEVGEAEGQAYIAMELVDGQPLDTRLAQGPLPMEQVLRYGLQVADALAHAHAHGLVHRDLKSANVVLTTDDRAKVLDFGLAKRLDESQLDGLTRSQASLTGPGVVVGTLAYMAPEQLRGQPADARSDVWALGVVLYEMATGARPFEGQTGFALSSAILKEPPRPLPAKVPLALRAVIERCLAKEPADRYGRAADVHAALDTIRTGTSAPWAAWRYGLRRHRWLALTAAVVALVAVLVGWNVGGIRDRLMGRTAVPTITSLVVLPLSNLSGDPAQEYVADGMTEALIAGLSGISSLRVVSRTSAMQYKGAKKPLRQIVSELGVDGVVEGGVLREGAQVRVTVQLIDGRTDTTLWSRTFERETSGILALHGEVVRAIVDEVKVALSPQEQALLASARPVNPEAYEAYLKGLMHWYKQTPQDVDRAMLYFEFATEKDPNFPLAHIAMGYIWIYYASAGLLPSGEARSKVIASIRKAVEIDENLAEAHEASADGKFYYDWDWAGAEKEYKRAIELKPNSVEMRMFYWEFLAAMKRLDEAEAEIARCLELDPLNSYVQMIYGMFLLSAHRFDDAVAQFGKILQAESDFGPAHLGLWQAHHHKGRYPEALAAATTYFSKWGDKEMADTLTAGQAKGGYREAMRAGAGKLAARQAETYVLALQVAMLHAYAGDKSQALDWLERAFDQRESGLVKLQIDPDWDTLRDEPRFQALLRRMNFPPS